MGGIVGVSADETSASEKKTRYEMAESIGKCNGQQGYDGWYYYSKSGDSGELVELPWDESEKNGAFGKGGTPSISFILMTPQYNNSAVLAWKAPYSGTVTLKLIDDMFRVSSYDGGGDVIATIKLNNEKIKKNDGTDAEWIFDKTKNENNSKTNYTITDLHINKGDIIYHEVNCGLNPSAATIWWRPIVEYSKFDTTEPEVTESPKPEKKMQFEMAESIGKCNGQQGYDGWYYYSKSGDSGELVELPWDESEKNGAFGKGGTPSISFILMTPQYNNSAVLAWKAPYSGTVTLKLIDDMFRVSSYDGGGDVIATIKLNNEKIKKNDGTDAEWIFDKTKNENNSKTNYTITDLHINKGDIIYHEVNCGLNPGAATIWWRPIVEYSAFDADEPEPTVNPTAAPTDTPEVTVTPEPDTERKTVFKKVDAFNECGGLQGYDGWYYYYKTGGTGVLKELAWTGTQFGTGVNINTHFITPDYNTPVVLAWEAPYNGIVTLSLTDNTMYRVDSHPNGGDSIATLKLNNEIIKMNNGQDARWIFDKNCKNGVGNQNYTITGVKVNKGDKIYHEVDCGEFNSSAGIYWKPIITYTYVEPYHIEGDGSKENPYLIDSADGLNAVVKEAANADGPIYSKFTADVISSRNTRSIAEYTGIIDGNNHKLTLKGNTFIEKAKGEVIIKNLIIDGNINGNNNAAAFIGNTNANTSNNIIIENCGNAAAVTASDNNAAGFVGWVKENDKLSIKNSYNYGSVTSSKGEANPFANADVSSEVIYENCYYLKDSAKANGTIPINPQNSIEKNDAEFASGEVAYRLGNSFGQRLSDPKDKYPVSRTANNGVYRRGSTYTNTLIETSELKFDMQTSFPTNGEQGKDGWYYLQYNSSKEEYEQLSWVGEYFASRDNAGNITSYITKQGIMQPTLSACIGYKAPMAGTIRITTGTNIFKTGKGANTTVKIILGDKIVWQETIPGDQTDESKGIKHDITLDVGCGDMIYFDVSAKEPTSAAVLWTPQVEYIQAAKFTAGDEQIFTTSQIKYGDSIECLFYDAGILEKKSNAYLAFYDEKGTMMKLSEPVNVGGNPDGSGGILSFNIDFDCENYGVCELELIIINGDGTNINPIIKHNLYRVK